jgi:homoserine dehydrogenase
MFLLKLNVLLQSNKKIKENYKMKKIGVGIIGFGTVGTGVAKILNEQTRMLAEKTGISISLKTICDLDISSKRNVKLGKTKLTSNVEELINDKDIDIVVELIGGINPAKQFILNALKNGKNVVTANKALLSDSAEELFKVAGENKVVLKFEASVGGGIPVLKSLTEGIIGNKIDSMYGIINGTANYILTNMSKYDREFADVLEEAQKKGFAEADPTYDIEGNDTAHKLAVLSILAYGIPVKFSDVFCEGITRISPIDFKYGKMLGYEIKLLAISKLHNQTLDLRVHPTLIPKDTILAKTSFENNAIYLKGNNVGPVMLYGKGAGMMPTASAVISDIVDIAKQICIEGNNIFNQNYYYAKKEFNIVPMFALKTKYYLRLTVKDKPYVLSTISKILGDNHISIASLIQPDNIDGKDATIVIMTHPTIEKSIAAALNQIDKLSIVKEKTFMLRVEDNFS